MPQPATGSVLFLEAEVVGAGGMKESRKNRPSPVKAQGLLRSEGTASSASRTDQRNQTQRKLHSSFTVSSGTLKKQVTL